MCVCRSEVKPSSSNWRHMEHSDWASLVQIDHSERQSKMDQWARLLKLAIGRIELKRIDPTFSVRSFRRVCLDFTFLRLISACQVGGSNGTSDRGNLAFEMAALDAWALNEVICRIEKNDFLREVLARDLRSIREAFLHAERSHEYANSIVYFFSKHHCYSTAASRPGSKHEYIHLDSELAIAYTLRAFLTSVLHLLTSVFQYLIGHVDRGGSKTYSSGAFDFRASFISLLLFQGAYVWIKFRQAAPPFSRKRKAPDVQHEVVDIETTNLKGVYARPIKEKSSDAIARFKYEPRFSPSRHEGDDGTDPCSKRLPLGEYHTRAEAQIVLQIARYYYDKNGGSVELEDGRYKFPIPPMSEQERGLAGKEKRTWVSRRAKQVGKQMYADFRREKGTQLDMATEAGSHARAESNDPSSSALPLACPSPPMLTTMATEPAIGSGAPSSPSLPLLPFDGAGVGDAYDSFEALSEFEDMFAELCYDPGMPNLSDHQSSVVSYQMQYQGFPQLPEDPSSPEFGGVAGGIEHNLEPELYPIPSFQEGRDLADAGTENVDGRIFLPQSVPVLQQLLLFHKKSLQDNARQFIDHHLKAYQTQISKLQQEQERLRAENKSLKSRLEQVAKSQVATWTGIMMDIQHRD